MLSWTSSRTTTRERTESRPPRRALASHRDRVGPVMRPALAARLSRLLVGCHPRRWRERYSEEMLDVLDQHQATARTVASLAPGHSHAAHT